MNKKLMIIISIVAVPVIAAATVLTLTLFPIKFSQGKFYVLEPRYHYTDGTGGMCMAMSADCGVCINSNGELGIVENKTCYLPL